MGLLRFFFFAVAGAWLLRRVFGWLLGSGGERPRAPQARHDVDPAERLSEQDIAEAEYEELP